MVQKYDFYIHLYSPVGSIRYIMCERPIGRLVWVHEPSVKRGGPDLPKGMRRNAAVSMRDMCRSTVKCRHNAKVSVRRRCNLVQKYFGHLLGMLAAVTADACRAT